MKKTDRELLALAAQATELTIEWEDSDLVRALIRPENGGTLREWNPLNDGGDALRLVAKLKLHIGMESHVANAWAPNDFRNFQTVNFVAYDEETALRRAIVLAAAAVAERRVP